jgi:hypothetical protein
MSGDRASGEGLRNGFLGFVPAMVVKNILDYKHISLLDDSSSLVE